MNAKDTLEPYFIRKPPPLEQYSQRLEEEFSLIIEAIFLKLEIETLFLEAIGEATNHTYIHLNAELQVYLRKLKEIQGKILRRARGFQKKIDTTTQW
jgi:hypothetical protein